MSDITLVAQTAHFEKSLNNTVFGHIAAANDNHRFRYCGICHCCRSEQFSNDPDVRCLRCDEVVEYTYKKLPVT